MGGARGGYGQRLRESQILRRPRSQARNRTRASPSSSKTSSRKAASSPSQPPNRRHYDLQTPRLRHRRTLLGSPDRHSPHRADQASHRQRFETGAGVTLATGRMYNSSLPFSRALGITLPIICYPGRFHLQPRHPRDCPRDPHSPPTRPPPHSPPRRSRPESLRLRARPLLCT